MKRRAEPPIFFQTPKSQEKEEDDDADNVAVEKALSFALVVEIKKTPNSQIRCMQFENAKLFFVLNLFLFDVSCCEPWRKRDKKYIRFFFCLLKRLLLFPSVSSSSFSVSPATNNTGGQKANCPTTRNRTKREEREKCHFFAASVVSLFSVSLPKGEITNAFLFFLFHCSKKGEELHFLHRFSSFCFHFMTVSRVVLIAREENSCYFP